MNTNFDAYVPSRILFGAGQLDSLHEQTLPGSKAMIVISNGRSTRANGYLDRLTTQLDRAGVTVDFHTVFPRQLAAVEGEQGSHRCARVVGHRGEFGRLDAVIADDRDTMERTIERFRSYLDCLEGAVEKVAVYGVGVWKIGDIFNSPALDEARAMGERA